MDMSKILTEDRLKVVIMWHKNQELLEEYNNKTGQNIKVKEIENYGN